MVVNFVEPTTVSAFVPILIVPLAVAEVVIDVILLNFDKPSAVLEAVVPLICSVIVVPLELFQ